MSYTPKYPEMRSVRGFNDKPVPAAIDTSIPTVANDQADFLYAVRTAIGSSIYTMHSFDEPAPSTENPTRTTGDKSLQDTLAIAHMVTRLPITVDEAAVRNKSWMYSYLTNVYIETSTSMNIIMFAGQSYTILNKSNSAITIYRRSFDSKGNPSLLRPVTISPSQTSVVQ